MILKGQTALVTGGTRGIGEAVASKLRDMGATVIVWGSNVDVRVESAITAALQEIERIDILINNAGKFGAVKSTLEYDRSEWDDVMAVNLTGQYLVSKHVIPKMLQRKYGRVVNMSSVVAKDVNPMAPAYCAAKAGVIALTKCLGKQLANTGVLVNCVTPSPAKTALFDNVPDEQIKIMISKVPLGRFIKVEEIADLVCWLASPECSASTGAVFDISGGRAQY